MDRLRLLLVLSVALNIGFLTLLILTRASTPGSSSPSVQTSDASLWVEPGADGGAPGDKAAHAGAEGSPFTRPGIYRRLAIHLRDADFSESHVRRVLLGAAWADWRDEVNRLQADHAQEEEWRPFWDDPGTMRRMTEAKREREAALAEVLGPDSLIDPWMLAQSRGLRNLPPEKQRAVVLVEEDYEMLTSEIHMKARGLLLPEDQEAMRLLKQERDRDLASLLSPDELEEYEVHSASSAEIRMELEFANLKKDDLQTIIRLRQDFDDEFGSWSGNAEYQAHRAEAERKLNEELRAALGEEKFQEYKRSRDFEFQQLAQLAQRLNLPRHRARDVYELKSLIEHQHREIEQDETLSPEDRAEAAELLVGEARSAISEAFGEEGARIYLDNGGWWLRSLESRIPELAAQP